LNRHQAQLAITSTPGIVSRFAAYFPASRIAGV
jgi:two-component system phosphate regulon sensor histidine kinase PhoR